MTGPSVSVVMCTCDGVRYVARQLRSVVEQSRTPDQVIVSDDASQDGTLDEARRSLEGAPCAVTVVRNPRRLGVAANFGKAMALAEGDIIVLSDQDDVWERQKLEVVTSMYASDPSLGAVFTDAALVDAELRPLSRTLWQALRFDRREQALFDRGRGVDVLLRRNVVAGATLSFHVRLRDAILPMPTVGLHDAWIALIAAASAKVAAVPLPLVRYRLHAANQVGISSAPGCRTARTGLSPRERSDEISFFVAFAERLRRRAVGEAAVRWSSAVDAKVALLRRRHDLPAGALARLTAVLPAVAVGDYRRYARGFPSAVHDVVFGAPADRPDVRLGCRRLGG